MKLYSDYDTCRKGRVNFVETYVEVLNLRLYRIFVNSMFIWVSFKFTFLILVG